MSKETRMQLEKVFDFIGEILAFAIAVFWAMCIINTNFPFLPEGVAAAFEIVRTWAMLVFVVVVGLEATIKRNFIIRLIFYVLIAIIIIFMCFPGTYNQIINAIPTK